MRAHRAGVILVALAIAACSRDPAPVALSPAEAPPAVPTPVSPPPAPAMVEWEIGFEGVNGVAYGSTPEALDTVLPADRSVGEELEPGAGCYHVTPSPADQPSPIAFMFDEHRFARVEVDAVDLVAPGGGKVGMSLADLRATYPVREEQPHHYVDGFYVIVAPPGGGDVRLVFETDETRVTSWRVGLPPAVHYVEGCA